jgi:hypothetical protein
MWNIYSSAKQNLNHPNAKWILLNVQIAKDMGTPKTIVIVRKDLMMFDVSYVV